mmetsp:Transcript_22565/g.52546  ORF Transcript_22565/g.52546 Transcript_22565/m.52546 type:complete len:137 (-) Transcript_22565:733-1143(-)
MVTGVRVSSSQSVCGCAGGKVIYAFLTVTSVGLVTYSGGEDFACEASRCFCASLSGSGSCYVLQVCAVALHPAFGVALGQARVSQPPREVAAAAEIQLRPALAKVGPVLRLAEQVEPQHWPGLREAPSLTRMAWCC